MSNLGMSENAFLKVSVYVGRGLLIFGTCCKVEWFSDLMGRMKVCSLGHIKNTISEGPAAGLELDSELCAFNSAVGCTSGTLSSPCKDGFSDAPPNSNS